MEETEKNNEETRRYVFIIVTDPVNLDYADIEIYGTFQMYAL